MSDNSSSENLPVGQTRWGRDRLPHKQGTNEWSLWTILKKCFGKELYRIAMPVEFNEPLSFIQRIAETFEYVELLEQASQEPDPVRRMQLVATFAVAGLSSNLNRMKKPFNPLLGETYELDRSDKDGFRILAEQVSHHPPVSAFYCESTNGNYVVEGCLNPQLKFWVKSIEIKPEGSIRVRFPKLNNEEYVWQNVGCSIHNVILGTLYFEQHGDQSITCGNTELLCRINYKKANGPTDIQLHSILGYIINKSGQKVSKISGKWSHEVYISSMADEGSKPIWQATPRPSHSADYYNFTAMSMALNEPLSAACSAKLPRTDSRFRPDIRYLEEGNIDGSSAEKCRLEEKQREARKKRNKNSGDWSPLWFEKVSDIYWRYSGGYWERPRQKSSPEIF